MLLINIIYILTSQCRQLNSLLIIHFYDIIFLKERTYYVQTVVTGTPTHCELGFTIASPSPRLCQIHIDSE
jgi:hypothetical protein